MTGGQNENPGAQAAQPGLGNRFAEAAGISKVTQAESRAKHAGLYEIHPEGGGEPFTIKARGREAWALDRLTEAGARHD
jgi:hypothetical protein